MKRHPPPNKYLRGKYRLCKPIGKGVYGEVWECRHMNTRKKFAIKIMFSETYDADNLQEMKILKMCSHKNVIKLLEFVHEEPYYYLVFDHYPTDLRRVIYQYYKGLQEEHVQKIMRQLLEALVHIHAIGIIHRDIKPQNIVTKKNGDIALIDFGISTLESNDGKYNFPANTLWYRPLEVLLFEEEEFEYSNAVDMWAVGCTMFELLTGRPLFTGCTYIGQIFKIFKVMGTPTEAELPYTYPLFKSTFPSWKKSRTAFCTISDNATDLITSCLHYDPRERLGAEAALQHKFFQQ
jgi:serine/threonine protein kinase